VKLGLVATLNRPGGNVTGVSWLNNTTASKRLELLRTLLPGAATIGLLLNPRNPNAAAEALDIETAARALGQQIRIGNASKRLRSTRRFPASCRLASMRYTSPPIRCSPPRAIR